MKICQKNVFLAKVIPAFDYSKIHKYLKKVDNWDVEKDKNENYFLIKEFKFDNFKESQNFVNKVSEIAEIEVIIQIFWMGLC